MHIGVIINISNHKFIIYCQQYYVYVVYSHDKVFICVRWIVNTLDMIILVVILNKFRVPNFIFVVEERKKSCISCQLPEVSAADQDSLVVNVHQRSRGSSIRNKHKLSTYHIKKRKLIYLNTFKKPKTNKKWNKKN